MFNLQEELCLRLLEFLESPHGTTDLLLADKEKVSYLISIEITRVSTWIFKIKYVIFSFSFVTPEK